MIEHKIYNFENGRGLSVISRHGGGYSITQCRVRANGGYELEPHSKETELVVWREVKEAINKVRNLPPLTDTKAYFIGGDPYVSNGYWHGK